MKDVAKEIDDKINEQIFYLGSIFLDVEFQFFELVVICTNVIDNQMTTILEDK